MTHLELVLFYAFSIRQSLVSVRAVISTLREIDEAVSIEKGKQMKNYTPKLSDPRVLKKIRSAYGFTKGAMSTNKPHGWAKVVFDKYFGRSNNKLGDYLRSTLVICTDSWYSKDQKIVKKYIANETGLNQIRALLLGSDKTDLSQWAIQNGVEKNIISLTPNTPSVQQVYDHYCVSKFCEQEYGDELDSLEFTYEDKSNRLWHPLQNVRKDFKRSVFISKNLNYQYDIDSCAPTLLHQHSQKCGMDLYLIALCKYLKDKSAIRIDLAEQMEISPSVVKVIINALFCGARIGRSEDFAISKLLDHDPAKIDFLKENLFITELRADIKTMWNYIEPSMAKAYATTKAGKQRKVALSSKKKWQLYFELERSILNQVRIYLDGTNNKYFLEHDGWATTNQINEVELINCINYKTGYEVKLKMDDLKNIISLTPNTPSVQQVYNYLGVDITNRKAFT